MAPPASSISSILVSVPVRDKHRIVLASQTLKKLSTVLPRCLPNEVLGHGYVELDEPSVPVLGCPAQIGLENEKQTVFPPSCLEVWWELSSSRIYEIDVHKNPQR